MNKADLQQELNLLLAQKLISGVIDRKNYIEWAISLIEKGYQSENLYILAGLDTNDEISIEHYFEKLIDDLQLERRKNENELFLIYTSNIAQQVVENKISPKQELSIMENIRIQTWDSDLSTNLFQFLYLDEDISLLGESQLFYNGLTEENVDIVIIQEMKMFLFKESKKIKDTSNLIYCNKCKSFRQSVYKRKGRFIKKQSCNCEKCDSKDYLDWYKVNDREKILAILEKGEDTSMIGDLNQSSQTKK